MNEIKPMSWGEVFNPCGKNLKQYREANNIEIPEGYRVTVFRMIVSASTIYFILGMIIGYILR